MSIYPPILTVSAVFLLTACAVSEPQSYEQTSRTAQGKVESMVTDTMPYRHRATLASAQLDSRPAVIHAAMTTDYPPHHLSAYIVQYGDTAYSLGRQFCAPIEDIKLYNGLDDDYSLLAGQTIILPRADEC